MKTQFKVTEKWKAGKRINDSKAKMSRELMKKEIESLNQGNNE
jgi:cytochrome c-type biogenesis protein CcmH/NrfF